MVDVQSNLKGTVSRISSPDNKPELRQPDLEHLKFWKHLPVPDRKLVVVAGSALAVGVVVGGAGVFLYRRWNDKLNEQVEVLSKSLGDVYSELRSLQQGMVNVQQTIHQIAKEPENGDGKVKRRPRRLQFYDSDSEDSSLYYSAAEEYSHKKPVRSILRKSLPNGSTLSPHDEPHLRSRLSSLNGYSPESPVRSPSDDDEDFEDAMQGPEELPSHTLIFEREFSKEESMSSDKENSPFEEMDFMLDSSVSNEQVIAALELIKSKEPFYPNDFEYLWRLAKATFIHANQVVKHDRTARTALIKEAKQYADTARRLNPNHPDVLKWSALTTGGLARYADKTQKLTLGLLTRQFLQSALNIRPNDASLHHILGRWNYEIANLGWFEKAAAKAIFGAFASVGFEDARLSFLEAERIKPKVFKSNMFYVAKCFARQNQKEEAKKWLQEALKVQRLCVEDELCDTDIQELMATLQL